MSPFTEDSPSPSLRGYVLHKIHPNRSSNMEITGRYSGTPINKVWLSLGRFVRSTQMRDKSCVKKNPIPNFIREIQKFCSLRPCHRGTDRRVSHRTRKQMASLNIFTPATIVQCWVGLQFVDSTVRGGAETSLYRSRCCRSGYYWVVCDDSGHSVSLLVLSATRSSRGPLLPGR